MERTACTSLREPTPQVPSLAWLFSSRHVAPSVSLHVNRLNIFPLHNQFVVSDRLNHAPCYVLFWVFFVQHSNKKNNILKMNNLWFQLKSKEVEDRLFTVASIQRLKKYKWNYSATRWSRFVPGGTLTVESDRQMSLLSNPLRIGGPINCTSV